MDAQSIQQMQAMLAEQNTQMQNMGRIVQDLQSTVARTESELVTSNRKITFLHEELGRKAAEITQLQAQGPGGGGSSRAHAGPTVRGGR